MIEILQKNVDSIQSKTQLEAFFSKLQTYDLGMMQGLSQAYTQEYLDLALSLRSKIIEVILQKGDVGESFYLISYLVFAPIEGKIDEAYELETFIQTSRTYFLQDGLGEIENLMLLELEVLCLILNAQAKQAIRRYIQGISHLEIHLGVMGKASEFIRQNFPKMGITMESFLESMSEILKPSYYTSLSLTRARSILNWQLHCFWNIQTFFNHRSWLNLYPLWRELFYFYLKSPKIDDLDHAVYMQFFIYHMCGNSYSSQAQWKEFCLEIDQPACKRYIAFGKEQNLAFKEQKSKAKILIGILRDRLVENSPYKVEYSFLKQLLQNEDFKARYQIKIYLMGLLEKSDNDIAVIQQYQDLGIEIADVGKECNLKGFYNSHLQKALKLNEWIRQDGVEVLISPNNGYGISDFILAVASARVQVFWSHGNFVYDVPNLDCKMTHICGNSTRIKHEDNTFLGIPVVMDQKFYNPLIHQEVIDHYRAKYPQDKVVLGTIGRLTKIDSLPYLKSVVTLMQEFPETIYLACGSGNLKEIQNKLRLILGGEYESFMQRFYFCGYVDSAIYGHLIDLWLDSFPMEQGESRIEYVAKGKLSLVLVKNPQNIQKEWITMAVNEEDYMQKARYLLGLNPEQKQKLIQEIMGGLQRYNETRKDLGVKTLLEYLDAKTSHSNGL